MLASTHHKRKDCIHDHQHDHAGAQRHRPVPTACEGGIQYWATVEAYRHSGKDFTANRARLVDRVAVDECGEAEASSRYVLTAELIGVTLRRVVALPASTFELSAGWKSRLTALHFAAAKPYFDDLDYDATDADVLVQVATLGRVVYG